MNTHALKDKSNLLPKSKVSAVSDNNETSVNALRHPLPVKNRKFRMEHLIVRLLQLFASVSIIAILVITAFIFMEGLPLIFKTGLVKFLFSLDWSPTRSSFGIGSMLVGSLYLTFSALLWSVPLGVSAAVFMAEIASKRAGNLLGRMVELLAGIPSVVYGFFGLIVIVLNPGNLGVMA